MTNLQELTKKELVVEARMRDVEIQESWTAAKIIQELKEAQIQKDFKLHCPKVTTIVLELKNLQVAREVLQEYFETCLENPTPHKKVRLGARLKHWLYRIQELKMLVSDNEKEVVTEIESEFKEYLNWMSQVTGNSGNQNPQQDNITNAEEGASVHSNP